MKMSERERKYREFIDLDCTKQKALELAIKTVKGNYYDKYPLIEKKERKRQTGEWYVSFYTKYPIFEPAEGGYCYDGIHLQESHSFTTRRKAKAYLRKMLKISTLGSDGEWHSNDRTSFGWNDRYVGEGYFFTLERIPGSEESGRKPYC